MFIFIAVQSGDCVGVCGNLCCIAGVVIDSRFLAFEYDVCLCKGCDGTCVFCLYCDVWSCRCSYMGSMSVSSCRCCMLVSCVHRVAVLSAACCMPCSLLMLVDHMEDQYYRTSLMTALQVAMSVSFCLPHPVDVSAFIISSDVCARTEML